MNFKRYAISGTETKSVEVGLKPLLVNSFIVKYKQLSTSTFSEIDDRYIQRLLRKNDDREAIISLLSDHTQLMKVLVSAHHNKDLIFAGASNTSSSFILAAVQKELPHISNNAALFITVVLSRFAAAQGNLISGAEWTIIQEIDIEKENFYDDLITEHLFRRAIAGFPTKFIQLEGRVPMAEWAQCIVEAFRPFVSELLRLNNYSNDLISFYARLRSYIKDSTTVDFGNKAQLFLENDDFKFLSQNYTLIKEALGKTGSASDPTLWNLEDARIRELLTDLNGLYGVAVKSASEVAKSVTVKRHLSLNGRTVNVVVEPNFLQKVEPKFFRALSSDRMTIFYSENRIASAFSLLGELNDITSEFNVAMQSEITELQNESGDPGVILLEGTDADDDLFEYLAVATAPRLYINREHYNTFYYGVDFDTKMHSGLPISVVARQGVTKDYKTALLVNAPEVNATELTVQSNVIEPIPEKRKYISSFLPFGTISMGEKDVTLRVPAEVKGEKKISVVVDVMRDLFGMTKGKYMFTGSREIKRQLDYISAVINFMESFMKDMKTEQNLAGTERELVNFRLINGMRKLLSKKTSVLDAIVNGVWKHVKDDSAKSTALYNDLLFGLDARLAAVALVLSFMNYDLPARLKQTVVGNVYMFADLAKQ